MVQMSLRLYEQLPKELPPRSNIVVHKDYVFSDKPLTISAKLDKGLYAQGDEILLTLKIFFMHISEVLTPLQEH